MVTARWKSSCRHPPISPWISRILTIGNTWWTPWKKLCTEPAARLVVPPEVPATGWRVKPVPPRCSAWVKMKNTMPRRSASACGITRCLSALPPQTIRKSPLPSLSRMAVAAAVSRHRLPAGCLMRGWRNSLRQRRPRWWGRLKPEERADGTRKAVEQPGSGCSGPAQKHLVNVTPGSSLAGVIVAAGGGWRQGCPALAGATRAAPVPAFGADETGGADDGSLVFVPLLPATYVFADCGWPGDCSVAHVPDHPAA